MKCATDCEDNFENKDEEFLNEHVKTFISGTEGKFFTKGDKWALKILIFYTTLVWDKIVFTGYKWFYLIT